MRGGFSIFHQINGMIGFARNWVAKMEIIGEYVRYFVQQFQNLRVEGTLRVLDRLGNRLAKRLISVLSCAHFRPQTNKLYQREA